MEIGKIAKVVNSLAKPQGLQMKGSFKDILNQKRKTTIEKPIAIPEIGLKDVVRQVTNHHEASLKALKSYMGKTEYSPAKLIHAQYETGRLFLQEQMVCKTAELSANSLKSFTQMQV